MDMPDRLFRRHCLHPGGLRSTAREAEWLPGKRMQTLPLNLIFLVLAIFPTALFAQKVPLEPNSNPAWERLHRHFQALQHRTDTVPIRILHIGDSHTASNAFAGQLRKLMQSRFGDGGPGFLPPGLLSGHPVNHVHLRQSNGWVCQRERKNLTSIEKGLGGFIGYGERPYQSIDYKLPSGNRDARLLVYADPQRVGLPSPWKVFHDGQEIQPVTRSWQGRSFYYLGQGSGQIDILSRGDKSGSRLRAVSILYEAPGVSYSALGVNGATLNILQEWRGETVRTQIADYRPELVILAFGTNDAVPKSFSDEGFVNTLRQTEGWLAEYAPNTAVLLVLPPHLPKHDQRVKANLETIRQQMRSFSRRNGWYVWDWSRAIDFDYHHSQLGQNSESLYAKDGIHLTASGYSKSANLLFEALTTVF